MIYSLIPKIEENPLFFGVSKEHTNKYLNESTSRIEKFSADEVAYSSRSNNIEVAFIIDGIARVYAGVSEEKALLRTLHRGDMFGIANLYDSADPYPTQIITATDSQIIFIDGEAFKAFIENDTRALKNYLGLQSKKIVYLNKKISTFTAGSAEKKLALFIYDNEANGAFVSPYSMSELAEILQMGRASLYRAIDSLIEYGAIEKQGKVILIKDKNKLINL